MAHELEIINGEAQMFSVKETPWHGLGKIVDKAPDAAEAIKLAGLNWGVKEMKLQTIDGQLPVDHKALVRDSDNSILGVVGKDYAPLQNQKAFEFFDPFVSSKNATFETAGSLREGKRIWVLAKLNRAPIEIVKGDVVQKYLLLSNAHDGTQAVRVTLTAIRVVCANTLAMTEGDTRIRIMHSSRLEKNLDAVSDIINTANATFEATAEQYRALTKAKVSQKDVEKYVKQVFNFQENPESERTKLSQERLMTRINELFQNGYGNQLKGVEGTYWALYNGVTQYLSYESGRAKDEGKMMSLEAKDSRLNSLWFGANRNVNESALELATVMAK